MLKGHGERYQLLQTNLSCLQIAQSLRPNRWGPGAFILLPRYDKCDRRDQLELFGSPTADCHNPRMA
ncbi:uncharacterized [Tachysurus ichikawai]